VKILQLLLLPVALLYGLLVAFRNMLYDLGLFSSKAFEETQVISVGNLSVGGTGKSPHVEYLIRLLYPLTKLPDGKSGIAVLSRGYGRISDGYILADEKSTAYDIGDEPCQFKQKFPEVPVAVDKNRVRGIKNLLDEFPLLNTVLLDDAFQHRAVRPDLSILLTDYSNLYINDFMMPAGRLREWSRTAQRADIIIVAKTPEIFSPLERRAIKEKIKPKPYQHTYFSYVKYGDFTPLFPKKDTKPLTKEFYFERNFSVLLITGIAKSSNLEYYLTEKMMRLKHLKYPDHYRYSSVDVQKIRKIFDNIASENKLILTTEKDAMRLSLPALEKELTGLPVFYIPIEVAFHDKDEEEFNEQIIGHVRRNKIHSRLYKRKG